MPGMEQQMKHQLVSASAQAAAAAARCVRSIPV
jgi:hypothetical protein